METSIQIYTANHHVFYKIYSSYIQTVLNPSTVFSHFEYDFGKNTIKERVNGRLTVTITYVHQSVW